MRRLITFLTTHAIAVGIGFALGIYLLPILTAPSSPDAAMLKEKAQSALFTAELTRDLKGSNFLHWGEGTISVSKDEIVHQGKLAPAQTILSTSPMSLSKMKPDLKPSKTKRAALVRSKHSVDSCKLSLTISTLVLIQASSCGAKVLVSLSPPQSAAKRYLSNARAHHCARPQQLPNQQRALARGAACQNTRFHTHPRAPDRFRAKCRRHRGYASYVC